MDAANSNFTITDKTTFSQLRALFPEKIPGPKPTYKALVEDKDVSVIACKVSTGGTIEVFSNGYIFYTCQAGEVVLAISECETYSYAADDEDLYKDEQGSGIYLGKDALGKELWPVPIALVGELRASRNSFNRKGDRNRYEPLGEDEEGNEMDQWEMIGDKKAVDPLQKIIEDESYEERVSVLSEKQRKVAELYADGFTQEQIADELGMKRETVKTHISRAGGKLENF